MIGNSSKWMILAASATVWMVTGASAQVRPWGPGGGPGGLPPMMVNKFQAWDTWRGKHPDVMTLQETLRTMNDLELDPKTALSRQQAKQVLAVISKWKSKASVTDEQARLINSLLMAPLTFDQIKVMANAPQGFFGGPGAGGDPGGRPRFDPASFPSPHDYNPLNAETLPMPWQRERAKERNAQFIAALKATAK